MSELQSEHFPLSAIDDYMIHNYPEPQRVMYTSDPRAYERYWFAIHDKAGDLMVVQGGGVYPNLNTTEAYAIVNYRGQHTTVRAFRLLGHDRTDMRIGPINAQVIEGLRTWRITLDENQWGISYDLTWHDTKRAVFHKMPASYHNGRLMNETAGFETFGYPEGWVKVNGQRFELSHDQYNGSRDRHWGIRNMVGGPKHWVETPAHGFGGQWVEFKDFGIWGNRILFNLGDPRPGAMRIIQQHRALKFHPESKVFIAGRVSNLLEDGRELVMEYERLGSQCAYLRCGMYGGRQGGTPDKDIWQGMYVADFHVEGETYDVTDPKVQAKLAGLDDHHCRVTCDGETVVGIFEPYDPVAYEFCRDGVPGYSLLE